MLPLPFQAAELAVVPKWPTPPPILAATPLRWPQGGVGTVADVLSVARVPWGPCSYLSGIWCSRPGEAQGMRPVCASSPGSRTRPFSDATTGRQDARKPRGTRLPGAPGTPGLLLVLAPRPWEGWAHTPRCITRRECMCSTALHSCTKYFHTVLSGMSRFCFLKYCGGGDRQTDKHG